MENYIQNKSVNIETSCVHYIVDANHSKHNKKAVHFFCPFKEKMLYSEYPIAAVTDFEDTFHKSEDSTKKSNTENFENSSKGQEPFLSNQCPPYVKNLFLKRVYILFGLQWLLTASLTTYVVVQDSLRHDLIESSPFVFLTSSILSIIIICGLSFWKNRHPCNILILFIFTCLQSLFVSCICASYYEAGLGKLLLIASGDTACIFIGLSLLVYCKKMEFEFLDGWLTIGIVSLLCMSVVSFFFPKVPSFDIVMTGLGCLVFSGFVLYDTSVLAKRMGPDDIIEAVITLYLDSINLFLFILDCLRISND